MKTTIDIADPLFRQVKARAALGHQSLKAFVHEALVEKIRQDVASGAATPARKGWRKAFGHVPPAVVRDVQTVIDEEFSNAHPEDWQ